MFCKLRRAVAWITRDLTIFNMFSKLRRAVAWITRDLTILICFPSWGVLLRELLGILLDIHRLKERIDEAYCMYLIYLKHILDFQNALTRLKCIDWVKVNLKYRILSVFQLTSVVLKTRKCSKCRCTQNEGLFFPRFIVNWHLTIVLRLFRLSDKLLSVR